MAITSNDNRPPGYPEGFQEEPYSALSSLVHLRAATRFPKWGLVILRGTYDNDDQWEAFINLYKSKVAFELQVYKKLEQLGPDFECTIIEDREALEGVTKDAVRDRFNRWVSERSVERDGEHGDALWLVQHVPRYRYCIYIDDVCLKSMTALLWGEQFGSGWGLTSGQMVLIDGMCIRTQPCTTQEAGENEEHEGHDHEDILGDGESDFEEDSEPGWEPIEGNTDFNVGWMYIDVSGAPLYADLCWDDAWQEVYGSHRPDWPPKLHLDGGCALLSAVPKDGPFRQIV